MRYCVITLDNSYIFEVRCSGAGPGFVWVKGERGKGERVKGERVKGERGKGLEGLYFY